MAYARAARRFTVKRRILACVPHTSMLHQRRLPLRLVSKNSQPQPHVLMRARSPSANRSTADWATRAGLRAILDHPLLRPIVLTSAAMGICQYAVRGVYILYATRELGLDALQIGLVLAVGGLAAAPGGLLADRVAARFGTGPAIWGGWLIEGAALLLLPLAGVLPAIPVLIAVQAIGGLAGAVANVNQWSLRQRVTPDHLQGRVTASHRFLIYGAFPIGALLGGLLVTQFGMQPALQLGALGAALCPLWLLRTPLRTKVPDNTRVTPR